MTGGFSSASSSSSTLSMDPVLTFTLTWVPLALLNDPGGLQKQFAAGDVHPVPDQHRAMAERTLLFAYPAEPEHSGQGF